MEGQQDEPIDLSEAEAAAEIQKIWNRGKEPPVEPDGPTPPPVTAQDVQPDPPQEEEGDTITIDPDAPLFDVTIKIEGGQSETKKVSLKDLESGYMMQADYQRKTAELARARDSLSQEVQKMVEPERQNFLQQMQMLHQAVYNLAVPEMQGINWDQLAVQDPAQYVQLSAKAQRVQQTLSHIDAQMKQAQQKAFQDAAERCSRELSQVIPNWGPEVAKSVVQTGIALGYSQDELAQVVDPRAIKALHELSEYRKLKEAKPVVEKKVTVVPKVLKPGSPGNNSDLQAKKQEELSQQHRREGSVNSAARVLLAQMNRKPNGRR